MTICGLENSYEQVSDNWSSLFRECVLYKLFHIHILVIFFVLFPESIQTHPLYPPLFTFFLSLKKKTKIKQKYKSACACVCGCVHTHTHWKEKRNKHRVCLCWSNIPEHAACPGMWLLFPVAESISFYYRVYHHYSSSITWSHTHVALVEPRAEVPGTSVWRAGASSPMILHFTGSKVVYVGSASQYSAS